MGFKESAQNLCCTWSGVNWLKKMLAFVCGGLIITTSVLSLINIFNFDILHYVRAIWNIIFGTLMVFIQLNWQKMISRNFGFLKHWFLRGVFYIFVGTNAMTWGSGTNDSVTPGDIFSVTVGFCCCFVGVVELLFGFKCASLEEGASDVEAQNRNPNSVRGNSVEPTLTVNLTPNQVAGAAGWAAANAGTVAKVANVAAASSERGGGNTSDNPFFGNQHRT